MIISSGWLLSLSTPSLEGMLYLYMDIVCREYKQGYNPP